jgi:hypothetical protein
MELNGPKGCGEFFGSAHAMALVWSAHGQTSDNGLFPPNQFLVGALQNSAELVKDFVDEQKRL